MSEFEYSSRRFAELKLVSRELQITLSYSNFEMLQYKDQIDFENKRQYTRQMDTAKTPNNQSKTLHPAVGFKRND